MTKEVEDIIRNKAYYELSSDERESVAEYAQNEEEYNNMQWFLTGTTTAFGAAQVEASPGLKKGVMEHLTEAKKKKGFWLNSVGVFMLPTNKKFYQKPAFQLGLAAALIVGLLFVLNPNVDENGLAVLDTSNDEPIEMVEQNESPEPIGQERELNLVTDSVLNDKLEEKITAQPEEIFSTDLKESNETTSADLGSLSPAVLANNVNEVSASMVLESDEVETEMEDAELNVSFDFGNEAEIEAGTVGVYTQSFSAAEELQVLSEKSLTTVSLNKDEQRDQMQTNSLRSNEKKKDTDIDKKLISKEPGVKEVDAVLRFESNSGSAFDKSEEWIIPKALHINKTKELNALFFIEK